MINLNASLGPVKVVLRHGLVERNNLLSLIMLSSLSDLLLIYRLSFLVEELDDSFSHHLLN